MTDRFVEMRQTLREQVADIVTAQGVAIGNDFDLVACSPTDAIEVMVDYLGTAALFYWIEDSEFGWHVDDIDQIPECWQLEFLRTVRV